MATRFAIREMTDEELEKEISYARGFTFPPAFTEARAWLRELEEEAARRKPLYATVPMKWSMYTSYGNLDVHCAVTAIAVDIESGAIETEKQFIEAMDEAYNRLRKIKVTREITDTEPRGQLRDWADMVGDRCGWNDIYSSDRKTGDKVFGGS